MAVSKKSLVYIFIALLVLAFLLPKGIQISIERPPEPVVTETGINLQLPLPNFKRYKDVKKKKQAFFGYLSPLVSHANQQIELDREFVKSMHGKSELSAEEEERLFALAEAYRVPSEDGFDKAFYDLMLRRIDTIPPALALAQAANESAWGTSRFATQGNNLFGEWCFKKGCGIEPADRAYKSYHEVASFDSVYDSINSYMLNLNRHYSYTELRKLRQQLRQSNQPVTAIALAQGLEKYSSRGKKYVEELRSMIRFNKLE